MEAEVVVNSFLYDDDNFYPDPLHLIYLHRHQIYIVRIHVVILPLNSLSAAPVG